MRFILWLIISCMGVFNPYVVEDAPDPFADEWIIEDADDPFEDVWIIENADDPFAQEGMIE